MSVLTNINRIGRFYRHIVRYRQIVGTLAAYGFDDIVQRLHIQKYVDLGRALLNREDRSSAAMATKTRPELFRLALEELGGSFIKLGQMLSTRPDLFPPAYLHELEKLQDGVEPFSSQLAREIIQSELEIAIDTVFESFPEAPIKSASISQVYQAKLRDGREVAVKVQRPDAGRLFEVDLEILAHLAGLAQHYVPELAAYQLGDIIDEFERSVSRELNFRAEAAHLRRFAHNFADDPRVAIPVVCDELSSRRVLTMTFIEGIKISDIPQLAAANVDLKLIAERGCELILEQIFEHGFFHGDPHPGNLLIVGSETIGFLDCGAMGSLPHYHRQHFVEFLVAFTQRDPRGLVRSLLRLTESTEPLQRQALEAGVAEILDEIASYPLKDISLERLLSQILELLREHRLKLYSGLYQLIRVLIVLEGLALRLNPDFKLIDRIKPYAQRMVRRQLSARTVARDLLASLRQLLDLAGELPYELHEIVSQMLRGQAKIEFEHVGLEPMLATHTHIANRVVSAIIIASLIVGSSIIVHAGVPPLWHDVPVIGIAGFVISGLMGLLLLFGIYRDQRR